MAKQQEPVNVMQDYNKLLIDFKQRKEAEFAVLRGIFIENTLEQVQERYKTFKWRGAVDFKSVCPAGAYIFGDMDACKTINLTNEGFRFSGTTHKDVPLIELPIITVRFLDNLMQFMDNPK